MKSDNTGWDKSKPYKRTEHEELPTASRFTHAFRRPRMKYNNNCCTRHIFWQMTGVSPRQHMTADGWTEATCIIDGSFLRVKHGRLKLGKLAWDRAPAAMWSSTSRWRGWRLCNLKRVGRQSPWRFLWARFFITCSFACSTEPSEREHHPGIGYWSQFTVNWTSVDFLTVIAHHPSKTGCRIFRAFSKAPLEHKNEPE